MIAISTVGLATILKLAQIRTPAAWHDMRVVAGTRLIGILRLWRTD
jgi:hypothetical protein